MHRLAFLELIFLPYVLRPAICKAVLWKPIMYVVSVVHFDAFEGA